MLQQPSLREGGMQERHCCRGIQACQRSFQGIARLSSGCSQSKSPSQHVAEGSPGWGQAAECLRPEALSGHAGCTVQGRPARLAAGALAAGLTGARTDAGRRASLPAGAASPAAVLLAAAALPLWCPGGCRHAGTLGPVV